ncbi:MAG: caspase family protein [Deltaproteobacteria bacterium]|nr:caspase family protein [Deltaproteobacteria bacterium]
MGYFTRLFRIPSENCFALFDEQATLGEFLDLFEDRLPSLVRKGDTVYCYFAGHGVPDVGDQTSYLLPYDGKPSNPRRTAYSSADLYTSLGRLKAKNVFVFLDACFSGASGRSKGQKLLFEGARPGVVQIKDQILAQKNLTLFAAAKSNQISNAYQEKQHGLFTYFLLKGLGGDSVCNKEGAIRVRDLADYIETNVNTISRRFGANLAQTPVVKGEQGKEDLVIVEKMQ